MAYYNKIGLLILNDDHTKFLVCEKYPQNVTAEYIMPGGKFEEASEVETLQAEIKEELRCEVVTESLEYVSTYEDVAAGRSDRTVSIKLYKGTIIGEPTPSTEIKEIHWIGKEDQSNVKVSSIVRNKIIPDLIHREILK